MNKFDHDSKEEMLRSQMIDAILKGNIPKLRNLLDQGLDPNFYVEDLPLISFAILYAGGKDGGDAMKRFAVVKELVTRYITSNYQTYDVDLSVTDKKGINGVLWYAASVDDGNRITKLLIDRGASLWSGLGNILNIWVARGDKEIVGSLVSKGVKINEQVEKKKIEGNEKKYKMEPYIMTGYTYDHEGNIIEVPNTDFEEIKTVNIPRISEEEVLLFAPSIFSARSKEMIDFLVEIGADPNITYKGYSPMDYFKKDDLLRIALMKNGSTPGPIQSRRM